MRPCVPPRLVCPGSYQNVGVEPPVRSGTCARQHGSRGLRSARWCGYRPVHSLWPGSSLNTGTELRGRLQLYGTLAISAECVCERHLSRRSTCGLEQSWGGRPDARGTGQAVVGEAMAGGARGSAPRVLPEDLDDDVQGGLLAAVPIPQQRVVDSSRNRKLVQPRVRIGHPPEGHAPHVVLQEQREQIRVA